MPIIAKAVAAFVPAPEGTHIARCIQVIELGTLVDDQYPSRYRVMLVFELPYQRVLTEAGEMPATVSKEYTLSISPKSKLGQHLQSWRGRAFTREEQQGFDLAKVAGVPCQVTISHKQTANGNVWADIVAITGLPKGVVCPDQVHDTVIYEIQQLNGGGFSKLPGWVQKKIMASEEWNAGMRATNAQAKPAGAGAVPVPAPEPTQEELAEDDVPF